MFYPQLPYSFFEVHFLMDLLNGTLDRNEQKLSLWSLSITETDILAMRSTLSLILSLKDLLFASRLIEASSLGGAF